MKEGLSSNTISDILQDKRGFLWFASDEGLNRFDGVNFKVYNDFQTLGTDNYVNVLFEDKKGKIWIGTGNGVYLYTYEIESFQFFNGKTSVGTGIHTPIYSITQDKSQCVWISTDAQGVFQYNVETGKLQQYAFEETGGWIPFLLVDATNTVWALSRNSQAIYKYNRSLNRFDLFPLKSPDSYSLHSVCIFEDSSHKLWLGTWENGLWQIERNTGKIIEYPVLQELGIRHIHHILEYQPHIFLITSDEGLYLFDTLTDRAQKFVHDEANPYSVSDNFLYPIKQDDEGGIWIGSYYGGINYIPANSNQFRRFYRSPLGNSVNGNFVGRFCEDTEGNIWIASDDGGICYYSPQHNTFVDATKKYALPHKNVHALCLDGDNLWIGTYAGGIEVLNTKTGYIRFYRSDVSKQNTLDDNSIYSIYKDRKGRIWATSMKGVNLYNQSTDDFLRVKDLASTTLDIKEDKHGRLWFATQSKGVFRYDMDENKWKQYGMAEGLPSLLVNNICVDEEGLWFATSRGLCKLDVGSNLIQTIVLNIPSNNIKCIIEEQQILWLTTAKGLVRYSPKGDVRVFTERDGLQNEYFFPNSGLKASDGMIYIGSVKGFNSFYTFQISENAVLPPVVFTGLEIFNQEIVVGSNSILPKNLNDLAQLELSYKDYVFSIHYAALSYCNSDKNQYAYKLEGFDPDWNYVGRQTKATYTNLQAGTYVFRVKVMNNDGHWNEEGTDMKIIVHPPFYLSLPFRIFYVILVCLMVALLIRFMLIRANKKHEAVIHQMNENKQREMHEAKIQFFTMIAHEIRTPVSLIIAPMEKLLQIAQNLPLVVRENLDIIDRNSQRLLDLVNQLLDFRKVEQEGMKMNFASQSINHLLKSVCERFRPLMEQKEIEFIVEYLETDFEVQVDSEAITKVVSNLLTNANKYTRNAVCLSYNVISEQSLFYIRVSDNGRGIADNDKEQIFKPFWQASENKPGTGIGLSIVKSIVKMHDGTVEVDSTLEKGTTFTVILPVRQCKVEGESNANILKKAIPQDILVTNLNVVVSKNKPIMLIVDDNEEMLKFLSANLSEKYFILTAEDGIQALDVLQKNEVALIISDLMMPNLNGIELCKAVRNNQHFSHIPFVLLTARTDINSKVESMNYGADTYIEKPFSIQYLEACIRNLLELRSLLREKFSRMPMVPLKSIACNHVDEDFLIRMNNLIEENIANPDLSVDFLVDNLCISRSGLFAKIKTLANITPNELIQVMRLKKAASLLIENKYRIGEICYMVGFNTPSYFTKCFQKQFGMKPIDFVTKQNLDE